MPDEVQVAELAAPTRLREAFERRDHAAAVATLAPDVVLHSPIIGGSAFEGREVVGDLLAAVMATFDGLTYTVDAEAGDVHVLGFRARVRGREVEAVDFVRVDDSGLVNDITVHIRPMAGLAHVAAALGPRLARGPIQRLVVTAFGVPMALLLDAVEPLIPRLVRTR